MKTNLANGESSFMEKNMISSEDKNYRNSDIKVSISCTTYNHEDYIADAIDSFLMQKTNFDFEILIHDDASTDETPNIIREYAKKYPDIIKPIYQAENQYSKGVTRIGYRFNDLRAKGKYIALCEGDDYWKDPYKLQKQVDYMESHPECSMCFHAAEIVHADKKLTGRKVKNYNNSCICPIEDLIIGGGAFCATASFLYPKKLIEKLPEFFLEAHVGDYPLQMILASKGYAYYIDEIMSAYRTGVRGSWTNRKLLDGNVKQNMIINHKKNINILDEFNEYTNHKYSDPVNRAKLLNEFEILVLSRKIKELKSSKYKEYYGEFGFIDKIKLYARCYFPGFYQKLINFKRNVKGLLSNFLGNKLMNLIANK